MKKYLLGFITAFGLLIGITAYANPSYFALHTGTATATTSPTYMTAGVATTSLAFTSSNNGNTYKIDKALIVFQARASTTQNQTVIARVQYSIDNVDWYAQTEATTTFNTAVEKSYTFTIATSSDQSVTRSGQTYTSYKSFTIDVPTPYVRVQFFVPIGGNPVDVWADYSPVKEQY